MIFMVLVGGIGTYEGPILGAILFFTIEALFGAVGVTYLIGLGATAMLFALLLPRGIWGRRRAALRAAAAADRLSAEGERRRFRRRSPLIRRAFERRA